MPDSKNSFLSPIIDVDLQRMLCFFLNKALLELYPGSVIEESAAGNFGFYSEIRFDMPPSTGFEKELERAVFSQIKANSFPEPIEMERRSALAYFKELRQKGAVRLISEQKEPLWPCLRQGSFIDPWTGESGGKGLFKSKVVTLSESIGFTLFEPMPSGSKIFRIEALGAFSKRDLKELVRIRKEYAQKRHEIRGKEYFYFLERKNKEFNKKPYKDFFLRILTEEGVDLFRRFEGAIQKCARKEGLKEWDIGGRAQSEYRELESFVNEQLEGSLGEFKFSFSTIERKESSYNLGKSSSLGGNFLNRGLFTAPFSTQFFLEGVIEKASLHTGIISSLQLIESILKMGGIENRKNLTSLPKGLHRDFEEYLESLESLQREEQKGEDRFFSLCFEAVDGQAGLWPIAWVQAKLLSKRSKHWKIEGALFIDEIIALQIETNGSGALNSWIEKLS